MLIDEIFYGLQGEGRQMGVPTVFIRTGGCNLRCAGFGCKMRSPITNEILVGCDTIHAARHDHFQHLWTEYNSAKQLIQAIIQLFPKHQDFSEPINIVFTGGEPLLWHKQNELIETVEYFINKGHAVWFETNGTINIDFIKYPVYNEVSMSISVKMLASGENKSDRWKPDVVSTYLQNTQGSYLKFVLSKDSLETEKTEIFEFLNMLTQNGIVYCMPLGETQEQINLNAQSVYEFATQHGMRYSDRLHIRIYNDKRGV